MVLSASAYLLPGQHGAEQNVNEEVVVQAQLFAGCLLQLRGEVAALLASRLHLHHRHILHHGQVSRV